MTNFDEIYSLNGAITKYYGQYEKPDNIFYFTMSQYLEFVIGIFCEYSYIDLLDYIPFSQEIYTYNTDTSITEYILDPAPPENCTFYIQLNGEVLNESEYNFDSLTNTLTLPSGGEIYVGAYNIGSFANTLSIKEKIIMADAMTEWFVESFVNNDSSLQQIMYSGVEINSQAQHNRTNLDIEKYRHSKSMKMMVMYTYSKNMPDSIFLAKRAGVVYE